MWSTGCRKGEPGYLGLRPGGVATAQLGLTGEGSEVLAGDIALAPPELPNPGAGMFPPFQALELGALGDSGRFPDFAFQMAPCSSESLLLLRLR